MRPVFLWTLDVGRWTLGVARLLLWPILWWGFATEALYCAPEPFDAPPALALDLSRVSAEDIARTVRHLQVIVRASEERALSLQHDLEVEHDAHLTALVESGKVQTALDAANSRAAKAEADVAVQRKWKWRWFWTWLGTVALVAAFFVARQYFPFLKLL